MPASWPALASITAEDARIVRITLERPDADFPRRLADGHAKVVAPEAVRVRGDLKAGPVVGSGPWVWDGGDQPGDSVFRANRTYFEPGLPRVERLSIHVLQEPQTLFAALAAGRMDVARVSSEQWQQLQGRDFRSVLAPRMGTGMLLTLNVSRPPFDREELRRAFFLALTPWETLEDIWGDQGLVGVGVPVVDPACLLPRSAMEVYFGQPGGAAQELRQVVSGGRLPLELAVANFGETYQRYSDRVARHLSLAGFAVTLQTLSPREYAEEAWGQREYQAFIGALPPVSTPNGFLFSVLHSGGRWNITGHDEEALDRLIEAQAAERDGAARGELVREIQRLVLKKGLLFMPRIAVERWAYAGRVEGFFPNLAASEYSFWARVAVER